VFFATSSWNGTVTGLSVDTAYQFTAIAKSFDNVISATSTASAALYTLANPATTVTASNPSQTTLDVDWSENGNATTTIYALYNATLNNYVASNGLGNESAPVYFTYLDWAGTVSGLLSNTSYQFGVVAQNGDGINATTSQKFRPHLFFNLGRLVSFAALGGVIGSVGAFARPSGGFLGGLIIAAGIVMFLLGIKLLEVFPRVSGLTLPSSIARLLHIDRDTREYSNVGAMLTGAITFFIPCGFTQAMQLYAVSTGSFVQGCIVMTLFALGTMPGLLGVGALSSAVRGSAARLFFKGAGIIVIILGLWNISNGWNLTGIVLSRPTPSGIVQQPGAIATLAVLNGGKQYMSMDQWAGGYNPNRFTVKKGVPVVWTITSTDSYTCASTIAIPSLGIAQSLNPGVNTLEFTPTQTGFIKFSCSMGMYTGLIEVIN
jgi:sulfite exporter TauE/SafE